MNIMNTCRKYGAKAVAVATMAVLPALAMADGTTADLMTQASTEIGALKAGLISFGGVVVGIAVTLATIGILKRGINKA